jgi:type I restriction enzyme S subunit
MTTWASVSLGEIVDLASGGTPKMSEPRFWGGTIPWISGASMHSTKAESSERRVTPAAIGSGTKMAPMGSTLVLVRGMSLLDEIRVSHVVCPVAFNQDVKALTPKSAIDPWFLTYALLANREWLKNAVHLAGHGTGVLSTERLSALPLSLPPLDEQRRIAEVLGALDDLIDTNERLVGHLLALAREVSERARSFLVPLRTFAEVAPPRLVKPSGTTAHYSLPAYDNGVAPDRVDGEAIKSGKLLIGEKVVLVSRLNPHSPRVWAVYPDVSILSVASTEFVPIRGVAASTEEIYAVTSTDAYISQLASRVTGTTGSHQRVDKTALLDFLVPDVRTLDDDSRGAISDLVREVQATRTMSATLRRTRDELLPLLMSGTVRVRPAEGAA